MTEKNSAARPGVLGTLGAGLTAAEHAAIALKVPNSGTDWLDAMIRESRRMDAVPQIAAALVRDPSAGGSVDYYVQASRHLAAALTEDPQP